MRNYENFENLKLTGYCMRLGQRATGSNLPNEFEGMDCKNGNKKVC